jgi:hypothetical protein
MNTYWGNFKYGQNPKMNLQIMENRNNFVEVNGICSYFDGNEEMVRMLDRTGIKDHIEHQECYLTKDDKCFIVSSVYDPDLQVEFEKRGWTRIPSLYSHDSYTFMIRYS